MPTTSNFGWTTPADTDLVKDGAAAIRTLGNNIDASLVDLKGGTTGQVLAKASNTDLDFTWSSVDPLTILDAKGDLITATAADTPARLAVGTNGQYLQADSTTATGLKWATVSAGGMTELATGTLSSTAVTISSIVSTYNHLVLEIKSPVAGNDAPIVIRPNGSATTYHGVEARNVATSGSVIAANNGGFRANNFFDINSANDVYLRCMIYNYSSTNDFKIANLLFTANRDSGEDYTGSVITAFRSTTAISSLEISANGETFSSGTYILYGVS